jgi:hypothetical protein
MKSEAEVLDNREFIEWFIEAVRNRLGCADVKIHVALILGTTLVTTRILAPLDLQPGDIVITFTCGGKAHIAKLRAEFSLYYRRNDGSVGKNRVNLRNPHIEAALIYDKKLGLLNNALIRIDDGTSIEIYELNPIPTTPVNQGLTQG